MSNASETNRDLLDRLREAVEKTPEPQKSESTVTAPMSPEQLLDLLKQKVGEGTSAPAQSAADDYDVSGFEIEEHTETEAEIKEAPPSAPADEEVDEAVADEKELEEDEKDEEDLPWETEDDLILEEESAEEIPAEPPTNDDEETPVFSVAEAPAEVSEPLEPISEKNETEGEATLEEPSSFEDPETVKKQIERFVEISMAAEDEVDYFARLDRRSERPKEEPINEEAEKTSEEELEAAQEPSATLLEEKSEVNSYAEPSPALKSFFFNERVEENGNGTAADERASSVLDDTDVNLLLSLGRKQTVEEAIGFVRVREAKNNFFDPTDDESATANTFAYNGEEYKTPNQIESIKTRYRKEKRALWARFAGSITLLLLLLVTKILSLLPTEIPIVSAFLSEPINTALVLLVGFVGASLLSLKQILYGARGFVTSRPNRYTPLSVIVFLNLFYDVMALTLLAEILPASYDIAIVAFLILAIVGDTIRLAKERLTFEVISAEKDKFALETADLSSSVCREEKVILSKDMLVEKVSFVGKYFQRTAKRSAAYTEYFIELLATIAVASFVAIGTAVLRQDYSASVNAFMCVVVVCMPMQHLLGSYPFAKLAKILYRHESAIIGETVDREYVGASTVYLDDIEVFGHHGVTVSGLRTYNDANFYDVLYLALAVFSRMEGPLRHVFDSSAQEIEEAKSVEIEKIHSDGIEALVDQTNKVLIGNHAFMTNKGLSPKYNEEDERRVESGEFCILYMSVNGVLFAKFYMKYTITKRFETFVNEMNANGTAVGVRTLDPNVTEQMLSHLHPEKKTAIAVIRPTLTDLVSIGRRSDSGLVTAKNSHIFSRLLTLCGRLKKVNGVWMLLRILSMAVGLLGILPVIIWGEVQWVSAFFAILYQAAWLLPSTIYTGTKLK